MRTAEISVAPRFTLGDRPATDVSISRMLIVDDEEDMRTLRNARLEALGYRVSAVTTGRLRYVDAGHGYVLLCRADGRDEPLVVHADPVLRRLLPTFLARRQQDLTVINHELERDGFSALEQLGHNLKGTGRSYGFDGISETGKALEQAAQHHDAAEIRRQATKLAEYLRRVRIAPA
jgi:HPt (histidine-containing phosphotransfer) domain-containing protein